MIKAGQEAKEKEYEGENWVFLRSKDGDLREYAATEAIFEKYKPKAVIHLAAFVGGLYRNKKYPTEFWHHNIAMNENVFKCCHKYKVEKLVSCLSTCIFPDKTTYPIDETMVHNGPPHSSNEGYAYAKRMIDVQNRLYNQQFGCKFTSVIPTNIYGPNDNFHLTDSHVIPGLMHRMYLKSKAGEDMDLWGTGKPLRQFIFADDLAKLFVWTLRKYDSCDPIILSVGEEDEVSIRDLVDMIAESMEFKGKIVCDTSKSDGQYKKTASNAKLRKLYPEFKFTPIKEGIATTTKWFLENFDTLRK